MLSFPFFEVSKAFVWIFKKYCIDSISVFKGTIDMKVTGTNLDNLKGAVNINNTSYQNVKDTYYFDDFDLKSSFDENNVRTISINSPDIVQGKIVGNFQIDQLRKMIENSFGSDFTSTSLRFNEDRLNSTHLYKISLISDNILLKSYVSHSVNITLPALPKVDCVIS